LRLVCAAGDATKVGEAGARLISAAVGTTVAAQIRRRMRRAEKRIDVPFSRGSDPDVFLPPRRRKSKGATINQQGNSRIQL
jgi:hypothetical protein